jgi:hypothetical protein
VPAYAMVSGWLLVSFPYTPQPRGCVPRHLGIRYAQVSRVRFRSFVGQSYSPCSRARITLAIKAGESWPSLVAEPQGIMLRIVLVIGSSKQISSLRNFVESQLDITSSSHAYVWEQWTMDDEHELHNRLVTSTARRSVLYSSEPARLVTCNGTRGFREPAAAGRREATIMSICRVLAVARRHEMSSETSILASVLVMIQPREATDHSCVRTLDLRLWNEDREHIEYVASGLQQCLLMA